MIITVTPNPALDMTFVVHGMEVGESHRVPTGKVRAGGKGINVARVIHQTGGDVLALATIGGRSGQEFKADLAAGGIRSRLVSASAPTRRSVAIVDDVNGATTVLNEHGAPLGEDECDLVLEQYVSLLDAGDVGCVTGSGSLPPGVPQEFYAHLVAAARSHNIPSVIDATGAALLRAAEAGATVLKPNLSELRESTGVPDPRAGAARLLELGARVVFVSLGADGMLGVARGGCWSARLPHALTGNPTGAGDAATAAIAVSIASGVSDPAVILRTATAWSAAAVLMPQAGEIAANHSELESQLIVTREA